MIKLVLATWRRMNGDNENWSVACRHTFKLILSSCLEGRDRSQRARKRERMGRKSCSWGGGGRGRVRTALTNEAGETAKKMGEEEERRKESCGREEVRAAD